MADTNLSSFIWSVADLLRAECTDTCDASFMRPFLVWSNVADRGQVYSDSQAPATSYHV